MTQLISSSTNSFSLFSSASPASSKLTSCLWCFSPSLLCSSSSSFFISPQVLAGFFQGKKTSYYINSHLPSAHLPCTSPLPTLISSFSLAWNAGFHIISYFLMPSLAQVGPIIYPAQPCDFSSLPFSLILLIKFFSFFLRLPLIVHTSVRCPHLERKQNSIKIKYSTHIPIQLVPVSLKIWPLGKRSRKL